MSFAKKISDLPDSSVLRKQAEEFLSGKKKSNKKKKVVEITYDQFLINKSKIKKKMTPLKIHNLIYKRKIKLCIFIKLQI